MKKIAFLFILSCFLSISCSVDDDNNTTQEIPQEVKVSLRFGHTWGDETITAVEFGNLNYTNQNGDVQSITKLKYLISNVLLHNIDGTTTVIKDYQLLDLNQENTLSFNSDSFVPTGQYNKISFVFGFNEEDNAQNYPDLNTASWNWPEMLGGGYHFMQLEGNYATNDGPQPYAYHHGTARVSEGEFEANHFTVEITGNFSITQVTTIDLEMKIDEWFKNPHTWDLNEYNTDLMGNYEAQIMMRENGASVFEEF